LKSHQKLCEALLGPQKELISHSDVVYLVSPNILNKMFKLVYLVNLMLLSYDHTTELKLNEVLSI